MIGFIFLSWNLFEYFSTALWRHTIIVQRIYRGWSFQRIYRRWTQRPYRSWTQRLYRGWSFNGFIGDRPTDKSNAYKSVEASNGTILLNNIPKWICSKCSLFAQHFTKSYIAGVYMYTLLFYT